MTKPIKGFNTVEDLRPDLVEDWDWELNTRKPDELCLGSDYYADWVCHVCGHRWRSRLDSRTKNMHGCPMCARTFGSSIPDLMLFDLCKSAFPEKRVFYRYNALPGMEADVFVSPNIAIEYNGYTFHKDTKEKDMVKKKCYAENDIVLYVFWERADRKLTYSIDGLDIYIPEFIPENFEWFKSMFVTVLSEKINLTKSAGNGFLLKSLEDYKYRSRKPIYSKSLASFLDNREDIFWDEYRNSVSPNDVYATVSDKHNYFCKYRHYFQLRALDVKLGYGCPYCSGHRNEDFDVWQKAYNIPLIYKGIADLGNTPLANLSSLPITDCVYTCPYCGKRHTKRFSTISSISSNIGEFCECTNLISKAFVHLLGEDYDERIFYIVEAGEKYFLGIANSIDTDYILSNCDRYTIIDNLQTMDIGVFIEFFGSAPSLFKTPWNSYNTIPISKENVRFELKFGYGNESSLYEKLYLQRKNGFSYASCEKVIKLTKDMVLNYIWKKLDSHFGIHFAVNQTVFGFNTDLASRTKGLAVMVKLNLANKKYKHILEEDLGSAGNRYVPIVITSYTDLSWSDRVVIIPSTLRESAYESTLDGVSEKVIALMEKDIKMGYLGVAY